MSANTDTIHGRRVSGDLRPTVVGRAEVISGRSFGALLLESGTARLTVGTERFDVSGPVLFWTHRAEDLRMTLASGAVGLYALIGPAPVQGAIGYRADSGLLRARAERQAILSLADRDDLMRDARDRLGALLVERGSDSPGARLAIEAHLRLLLIVLWRASHPDPEGVAQEAPGAGFFERFTGLVERHFRDRWTVQDYAAGLGISRDRLGDICRRACGQPPKRVIARRVLVEARLLLTQSARSVQQIADMLGFASASHFSRAFSRETGLTPGAYRTAHARPAEGRKIEPELYAWP